MSGPVEARVGPRPKPPRWTAPAAMSAGSGSSSSLANPICTVGAWRAAWASETPRGGSAWARSETAPVMRRMNALAAVIRRRRTPRHSPRRGPLPALGVHQGSRGYCTIRDPGAVDVSISPVSMASPDARLLTSALNEYLNGLYPPEDNFLALDDDEVRDGRGVLLIARTEEGPVG